MNHLAVLPRILFIYLAAFLIMSLAYAEETTPPADATKTAPAEASKAADTAKPEESAKPAEPAKKETKKQAKSKGGKKMFALMDTTMGKIKIELFSEKAPKTVENFVGLAEGTKEWTDPKSGKKQKKPYYDGIIFHRVIDGFMVQTGDPTGTGMGGPGYQFADEFHKDLKHTGPGILSMANAGPNTNGSQFFITVEKTEFLDFDHPRNLPRKGGHAVFGKVVEGLDVVQKISKTPRDSSDRPLTEVKINSVKIVRE
ncbi:MAG: peptidylprolyl isomerase [Bdellovibrionia bacterium]